MTGRDHLGGRSVVVAGSLGQRVHYGGHAWVFLQYLRGFRRLGWDVTFIDRLDPEMCVDDEGRRSPVNGSTNVRYLESVFERAGLLGSLGVLTCKGACSFGLDRPELIKRARRSALLLNVMGYLDDQEILEAASFRVFLDIDPGFPQMWQDQGLHTSLRGHDAYVTLAAKIGSDDCTIPTCGRDWITTVPPVVLTEWPVSPARDDRFTTVASWRGPFAPLQQGDVTYGLRVHEFRKFLSLPSLTGKPFQLALDIHEAESLDLQRLQDNGWQLINPRAVAGDPGQYRAYVQESFAEFMVAKNMYVQSRSGWVSDRSVCYLASGKPVLAQDTGLKERYPTGEGLVTFSTLDEAVEGVERITRDYERHCRAAREIAEEHFDSDIVLPRLLGAFGVA